MTNRVAFFATKEDVESYFNLEINDESVFEDHYNISPGHQIPVILSALNGESLQVDKIPWGFLSNSEAEKTTIHSDQIEAAIKNNNLQRCIIPLSGFYVWKDKQKQDQPFFVRMLNSSVMTVAGVIEKGDNKFVSIVTTASNPLIQPMSANMPLLFDKSTSLKWLDTANKPTEVIEAANKLFLLTDLSVLRVSKKVNDPTNNNPKLIQPIPK